MLERSESLEHWKLSAFTIKEHGKTCTKMHTIVAWQTHGTTFSLSSQKDFAPSILPHCSFPCLDSSFLFQSFIFSIILLPNGHMAKICLESWIEPSVADPCSDPQSGLNDLSPETMKWPRPFWFVQCLNQNLTASKSMQNLRICPSYPCSNHVAFPHPLNCWFSLPCMIYRFVDRFAGPLMSSVIFVSSCLDGKDDRSCCACGTRLELAINCVYQHTICWIKESAKKLRQRVLEFWFPLQRYEYEVFGTGFRVSA